MTSKNTWKVQRILPGNSSPQKCLWWVYIMRSCRNPLVWVRPSRRWVPPIKRAHLQKCSSLKRHRRPHQLNAKASPSSVLRKIRYSNACNNSKNNSWQHLILLRQLVIKIGGMVLGIISSNTVQIIWRKMIRSSWRPITPTTQRHRRRETMCLRNWSKRLIVGRINRIK